MRVWNAPSATALIALVWGCLSCQGTANLSANSQGNPANCPQPPTSPTPIKIEQERDFYNSLQSRKIIADADTITFQSAKYDFVFCRGNNKWVVQPGTLKTEESKPQDYEATIAKLANPLYEKIDWQGKTYQYRLLLDPNPFPNFQIEPQQVIFELISPEQKQPQRQVLYTLPQVKQKKAGIQLGIPQVTAVIPEGEQLFWSIAPEQGEGNGGIATIVSYTPKTNKISLLQPPGLAEQQIMDLTVTGEGKNLTFWLATQQSGEGNPYLPSLGLVAYRPEAGTFTAYHVRNSPLIGAIPKKLQREGELLWVSTGNGICQLKWQKADNPQNWTCWRFALLAKLPSQEVPLYPSLFSQEVGGKLTPDGTKMVEVLWWSPHNNQPGRGRYEVSYHRGFTLKLNQPGASPWSEVYPSPPPWESPLNWVGNDWHWQGDRFVRPFDAVSVNEFGGGPLGIGTGELRQGTHSETNAMRGDLELLEFTKNTTAVKYYSGWVEDNLLTPYLTLVPYRPPATSKPNPLSATTN